MTPFNDNGNFKQFQLIRFINENCNDEHVMTKITIVLRRDKIEAPYYMDTKIRLTSCVDNESSGLIHAMDILNHHRMYNLSEAKYNEIKSIIDSTIDDSPSDEVKISLKEKELKMVLMSRNHEEIENLFSRYDELFEKIDCIID